MIRTNWLNITARFLGVAALGLGVVACGDDDGPNNTPDASTPVDSGGGQADACVGHECPGVGSFMLPEGGEVRLELFQAQNEQQDRLAAHAFFFRNQNPPIRGITGTPITPMGLLTCFDVSSGDQFVSGGWQANQAVADTREYRDLGGTVSLTSEKDADNTITLTKRAPGERDQNPGLQHDIVYTGDDGAVDLLTPNTYYKFAIEGTAEFPALDLTDGASPAMELFTETNRLYFPNDFTLTSPTEAEYYTDLTFTKGEDAVITWDNGEKDPMTPATLPFIAFVNKDTTESVIMCIQGADEGTMTVPASVIDMAPETGSLLFGKFTHIAYELDLEDGQRVDLLGINCKYGETYNIVSAN